MLLLRSEPSGQSLEEPDPPELYYIWRWFESLSDWREQGWGVGPLSHQEIDAWVRLMQIEVYPSEVEALRQIDRAVREHYANKDNPKMSKPSLAEQFIALRDARAAQKRADNLQEEKRRRVIARG